MEIDVVESAFESGSPAVQVGDDAILPAAAAMAAALSLSACGSGGDSESSQSAEAKTSTLVVSLTSAQASRFLGQASMGATKAMIADVAASGYAGWLTAQFAMPRATTHWDWLVANGYAVSGNRGNLNGFDASMWRQLIVEPDQLRQRVGMALLDILVVGITGITFDWRQFAMASYVDVLMDNAFGNYRTILEAITYNAAMASFLTYFYNHKATPNGAQPDENYARELMQLFTIGGSQLNMDGTAKTTDGTTMIDSFTAADVSQLARIFTGLGPSSTDQTTPARLREKLVMIPAYNETEPSTFLGKTISGGGTAAIGAALDTIFAHPNLPPFISKQLIQRLVTSNPSPAYVGRVAAVFANSGGVRGDMKAVIRAILLDMEARSDPALLGTSAGKLREPVMRLTGWARAYNASSASNSWALGDTSSQSNRIGQSMGRATTVFNFFRPGYRPPNTGIATAGLVAPEFQIANEQSVIAYVNYMYALVINQNNAGDLIADYTAATAQDSATLVDDANILLAAGQLSAATVSAIRAAVDSVPANAARVNRVFTAVLLTLASPEYLTLK